MSQSRRRFLARTTAGLVGAAAVTAESRGGRVSQPIPSHAAARGHAPGVRDGASGRPGDSPPRPSSRPRSSSASSSRPRSSRRSPESWPSMMAATIEERRTGRASSPSRRRSRRPRSGTRWCPGVAPGPTRDRFVRWNANSARFPRRDDEDRVRDRSPRSPRGSKSRALTSERLTRIYIERCERLDPKIREHHHADEGRRAGAGEAGRRRDRRGEVPRAAPWHSLRREDLLDTKHPERPRARSPTGTGSREAGSVVVARLQNAGAVLLAKLSLGALALNDVWFGGQTMNPWLLEEGLGRLERRSRSRDRRGARGAFRSAARPGARSWTRRCAAASAGLRPTFGKVPRTGAMTLCWTLDKLGPIRSRRGHDARAPVHLGPRPRRILERPEPPRLSNAARQRSQDRLHRALDELQAPARDVDRAALETMKKLGITAVPVELPDWPYDSLNTVLFAEGAAAFEELTLSGGMDQLKMQVPDAWPNLFRQSRFLFAVDYFQADLDGVARLRRTCSARSDRACSRPRCAARS